MSDEELELIEKSYQESTQGEWKILLGRPASDKTIRVPLVVARQPVFINGEQQFEDRVQKIDPRFDVYCGEEAKNISELKGRVQITHFHPEAPLIWDRHANLKDGEFIIMAHKWIPRLIEEIKHLRRKNG